MSEISAHELVERARRTILRLSPPDAFTAQQAGAVLVDLRCAADRTGEGEITGAIPIALSVLPWRADPQSEFRDDRIADRSLTLILVCNDGYSSSLGAAWLAEMGFTKAGDVAGGFRAWSAAGLPVTR
ncbi:MAG: rhodanese-like domain-containing protein [Acidimicrobiia bacterium]|nr:rhodanese-like domain-containing protein [Acidimicrobiia bacterium]